MLSIVSKDIMTYVLECRMYHNIESWLVHFTSLDTYRTTLYDVQRFVADSKNTLQLVVYHMRTLLTFVLIVRQ